ncbi:MAG TPA: tRNA (adenosine(37)-N6)-threonylcarbamoyltransferase complex transferase subunit TsaD, partial [Candidimonas sp.]|nr:tRNA (adenosine(37)-N6)-threonylcarbamoyltransferase complex transferase subunit TsaD [Candidimonas sp.]
LMGLGYPGGPALSRLAQEGDATVYDLPRPMLHSRDLDFSFSGLKTAVLTRVKNLEKDGGQLEPQQRADLAAATEAAIVDVLAAKSIKAMKQTGLKRLVVAGGVGANSHLRAKLVQAMGKLGGEVFFPPLDLCTDNGAMIAFAAAMRVNAGLVDLSDMRHAFTVKPRWDLQDVCLTASAA